MEVGLTKYNSHNYLNRTQPNNFKSDRTNVGYNTKPGNNISFQSRIEFVDTKTFENLIMQLAKAGKGKKVEYGNNCQLYVLDDIIYTTEDIMTCTGGGFTDGIRKALGFHWFDEKYQKADKWCNEVLNKLRKMASQKRNSSAYQISSPIKDKNNPLDINGVIIGGKNLDTTPHSVKMLETILDKFKGKIKNLSIFQEHLHAKSSTSYIYNLENDTWTLKADYFDNDTGEFKDVLSLDELMNLYNRIYIADNDQLYINGKEIPRETINRLLNNSQRIDGPTPVLEGTKPFTEIWGWSFLG